ncbi:MAG TPA: sialidase family protein [Pyrinomonadaceae bacterium]|nr:sialidase family protein [Pyrinomonadaceae bacterium]
MKSSFRRAAAVLLLLSAAHTSGARQDNSGGPARSGGHGGAARVRTLPSPAGPSSGQPNLAAGPDGSIYLSWIERLPERRFALRFSKREGAGWSAPRTVAEGDNWFVNWADFPSLLALPGGRLAAHWLVKSGPGPYAYDVHVALSADGGRNWGRPVTPHRDGKQVEHGFVSMWASPEGTPALVWLDGRETTAHGAGGGHDGHGGGDMTLRYTAFGRDGRPAPESLLDARVCECCQTSAAMTSEGPIVVYRDRSPEEVRDIAVVRLSGGRWSEPSVVYRDGWRIEGCPVNGPSVAARGRRVAVAWFTGAGDTYRVRVAFSGDAGRSFGQPVEVDDGQPSGRVGVVMLEDGSAAVSWLEKVEAGGEVRVRRVRPDGRRGPSFTVAGMAAARAGGFPRMVRTKGSLLLAWVGGTQVLTAEVALP